MKPHIDQGAHDGPHHVAQEAVGRDGKHPPLAVKWRPLGVCHLAIVGFHVGVQLAERREIGVQPQPAGCLVHQVEVKLVVACPAVLVEKGALEGVDEVLVGAARGVKSRMGITGHGKYLVDGNALAQYAVQAVHEPACVGNGRLGVEVRNHHGSVHARVGAPGSSDAYGRVQHHGHGLLNGLLHAHVVGLHLPAVVGAAVVGQSYEIAHECVLLVA